MISVQEVSTLDGFRDMESEWDGLLKAGKIDNMFLRFDWLMTWWRYFSMNCTLFILKVMDDGQLIGIAPLMIKRHRFFGLPVRTVFFIGTDVSDRMDFILMRSKRESLLAILNYFVNNSHKWDSIDLQEMPAGTGNAQLFRECIKTLKYRTIFGPDSKTLYIPLNGNKENFFHSLSKNIYKQLRKARNRVGRMGSDFVVRRFINTADCPEDLTSEMQRIEDISWKGQRCTGIFSKRNSRLFHNEIIRNYSGRGLIDISFLTVEGKNIAYEYNYFYENRIHFYNCAYDPEYAHLSPGLVLMIHLIQDSFNRKIDEFDFLRGEEELKQRLTSNYKIHTRTRLFNNRTYSKFLYFLQLYILPYLKNKKTIYKSWMWLKRRIHAFKARAQKYSKDDSI